MQDLSPAAARDACFDSIEQDLDRIHERMYSRYGNAAPQMCVAFALLLVEGAINTVEEVLRDIDLT